LRFFLKNDAADFVLLALHRLDQPKLKQDEGAASGVDGCIASHRLAARLAQRLHSGAKAVVDGFIAQLLVRHLAKVAAWR